MEEIMNSINRDHFVANFEELVIENQIQTAIDVLTAAESEDQIYVIQQIRPALLERFVQALDREDRFEVIDQITEEARDTLLQALEEAEKLGREAAVNLPGEEAETAADLIEEAIEEIERVPEGITTTEEPTIIPGRVDFEIADGHLRRCSPGAAMITVYSNPTSAAQRDLLESLGIDDHMLESALDPDELSRLEYDHDGQHGFIVLKRPHREAAGQPELLGIASIGISLLHNHLTIVTPDDDPLLEEGDRAESVRMLLLRIMSSIVAEFLMELKRVKRTSREIQAKLSKSIENREFLRMFSLSEGLVYQINAIEGNGRVLRRLRHLSPRLEFDEEELEYLDDIVIDNDQCSHQAQIFSTVLGGLLDARGNIINNNMNTLLKNLTIINVVFLPLSVISGILGMSEFSLFLNEWHIDWHYGYAIFSAAMVLLGLGLWWLVRKLADRWGASNGNPQTAKGERLRRKKRE